MRWRPSRRALDSLIGGCRGSGFLPKAEPQLCLGEGHWVPRSLRSKPREPVWFVQNTDLSLRALVGDGLWMPSLESPSHRGFVSRIHNPAGMSNENPADASARRGCSPPAAFVSAGHLDKLIIICTRQINERLHIVKASID